MKTARIMRAACAAGLAAACLCGIAGCSSNESASGLTGGVAATVNTDNMTVSRTTLAQEFASLRLSPQERRAVLLHSAEAAFLPPAQKAALRQAVEAALAH